MRTWLHYHAGRFETYTAVFGYFSRQRKDTDCVTVLLEDVRDSRGYIVADHVWIKEPAAFEALPLGGGQRVKFRAKAREYRRKYGSKDFELTEISRVKMVNLR